MPSVLMLGTFATKQAPLEFLQRALEAHGIDVVPIDLSLQTGATPVSGAEKLALMKQSAADASARMAEHLTDCVAAVGLGGGTGAEIVFGALKGLPADYPKVLVSTLPFDPRPMLADSAITLIPTLCDIEGMNHMLAQTLENTAAAIAGLTRARPLPRGDSRTIALTTLGATGKAGENTAKALTDAGFEPVVFHANGYGGAAFSRFVGEGNASGVIDLNVHELGRLRLAGAHVPMDNRFTVARALPRVVLPGALNFIGLGAVETLSEAHRARPHYRHTEQFTHVKLTAEEMSDQARALAALLNEATAPTCVIVPMGGFSHEDTPGGAIEDADLRDIFRREIETAARVYEVVSLPDHINSAAVADAAVAALTERMPR